MRNLLMVLMVVALLFSCNDDLVRSEYRATDGGAWNKDKTFEFTFSELDSVEAYDLFISVRNDATFPYSNLFLIAELEAPTGETVKDTLQYEMALPDGHLAWQGLR